MLEVIAIAVINDHEVVEQSVALHLVLAHREYRGHRERMSYYFIYITSIGGSTPNSLRYHRLGYCEVLIQTQFKTMSRVLSLFVTWHYSDDYIIGLLINLLNYITEIFTGLAGIYQWGHICVNG